MKRPLKVRKPEEISSKVMTAINRINPELMGMVTKLQESRGMSALSALHSLLLDKRYEGVRTDIIHTLWSIGDEKSVDPLLQVLKGKVSSNPDVRGAAALSLADATGRFKDPRIFKTLNAILKEKSTKMRVYATTALGRVRGPDERKAEAALKRTLFNPKEVLPVKDEAFDALKDLWEVSVEWKEERKLAALRPKKLK